MENGKDAYTGGEDTAVIRNMDAFLKDYGESARADEAYYYRARSRYRLKDYRGAKADILETLARTRHEAIRASSLIVLGDVGYDTGDMPLAEQNYREALALAPQASAPADYVLLRLGVVLQRRGKWDEADRQFDRLDYVFPGSDLSRLAARKVRATAWTVQVGAYQRRAGAEAGAAKFRAQRFTPEIRPARNGGQPFFVVCVGRFRTYDGATQALKDLQQLQPDAFATVTR
ncbi:MAG TPA: SPOR domain-containing protein [Phycisphaerae bacterium]|nr:SPOR domain-containing protein [Phycisphaerae bacterium]